MYKSLIVSLLFVPELHTSSAQSSLPAFFSDNMVLQQQLSAALWGMDKPGTRILVAASRGVRATGTTDEKGQWKLKLQTPVAGGPYEIAAIGRTTEHT